MAVAEVSVANLYTVSFREFCKKALIQLFNDPNKEVRSQAAKCFFGFEREELGEHISLVESFVLSSAFTTSYQGLIRALKKTTAKLPEVTCQVCQHFINAVGADAPDIHARSGAEADTVSQLLIRVYTQNKNLALQSRCLDSIDRMVQIRAYGLNQALELYER